MDLVKWNTMPPFKLMSKKEISDDIKIFIVVY